MTIPIHEAHDLSAAAIALALGTRDDRCDERLKRLVAEGAARRPEAYNRLRIAVHARLTELGATAQERAVCMYAADMATTIAVHDDALPERDRLALRRLWDQLRSRP